MDHLILAMVSDIVIFGMLIAYHIKLPLDLPSQADAVVPVSQGLKIEEYKFSPDVRRVRSYQFRDISIVASSAIEFGVTDGQCEHVAQNDNLKPAFYDLNCYRPPILRHGTRMAEGTKVPAGATGTIVHKIH